MSSFRYNETLQCLGASISVGIVYTIPIQSLFNKRPRVINSFQTDPDSLGINIFIKTLVALICPGASSQLPLSLRFISHILSPVWGLLGLWIFGTFNGSANQVFASSAIEMNWLCRHLDFSPESLLPLCSPPPCACALLPANNFGFSLSPGMFF